MVGSGAEAIVGAVKDGVPATVGCDAYGDGTASERIAMILNG